MDSFVEETRPGRPCPVDGCNQRLLNADTGGRHLDQVHDEAGRWVDTRYRAVDKVDGDDVVIFNTKIETEWIQSSVAMEVEQ